MGSAIRHHGVLRAGLVRAATGTCPLTGPGADSMTIADGKPDAQPGGPVRGGRDARSSAVTPASAGYPGLVRSAMTLLTAAFISAVLSACSSAPARPEHPVPSPAASSPLSLTCSDSAGQQGQDREAVIGGGEGLVLPGSGDPAGLYPIGSAGGTRYFIYKA